MSVTGKTLGIVAIGLVGIVVYLLAYVTGVLGIASVAGAFIYVGLALTVVLGIIVLALCFSKTVE